MRNKSIIQSEKQCYYNLPGKLDPHEPIGGGSRQTSIDEGLWLWVERVKHRWLHDTPEGRIENKRLQKVCQAEWMKRNNNDRAKWYKLFYEFFD